MTTDSFNLFIKKLPNISGIGLYFFDSFLGPNVVYNEVRNKFYRIKEIEKGYRKYSISTQQSISALEESELYKYVEKDLFHMYQYNFFTKEKIKLI